MVSSSRIVKNLQRKKFRDLQHIIFTTVFYVEFSQLLTPPSPINVIQAPIYLNYQFLQQQLALLQIQSTNVLLYWFLTFFRQTSIHITLLGK